MPIHEFEIDSNASSEGTIHIEKSFQMPLSVKVKSLSLKTNTSCLNRIHSAKATINDIIYIDSKIKDCSDTTFDNDLQLEAGESKLYLHIDNFNPGEIIKGSGMVEYQITLV